MSNDNAELQPGQLVRHKTGGPTMVVVSPPGTEAGSELYGLRWWDEQRRCFQSEELDPAELVPADEPSPEGPLSRVEVWKPGQGWAKRALLGGEPAQDETVPPWLMALVGSVAPIPHGWIPSVCSAWQGHGSPPLAEITDAHILQIARVAGLAPESGEAAREQLWAMIQRLRAEQEADHG